MTIEHAKIRIARPTDNLDALLPFYRDGLGFNVLYEFGGHGYFDGIMLGHPGAPYHIEFTKAHGHTAGRAPTEDNLLVFYLRMRRAGFSPATAFNAYWDVKGVTFEDPDGYRVVLQNAAWAV